MRDYSINPASGAFGAGWPASGAIPESYSAAGWTIDNEGFKQQTFLGASITNFNVAGGFGDSSSTMDISLVNDEYNKSDGTSLGLGDDVYHSGNGDNFLPPPVGSPVFFKFGKNLCTVEQAWRNVFDETYGWKTIDPIKPFKETTIQGGLKELPGNSFVDVERSEFSEGTYLVIDKSPALDPEYNGLGSGHFVFGGILQSYNESAGTQGTTYRVVVVDPREILSNTTLILSNYADSTFGSPNLLNVFGFLEFNPPTKLRDELNEHYDLLGLLDKVVNSDGSVNYVGGYKPELTDIYTTQNWIDNIYERELEAGSNLSETLETLYTEILDAGLPFRFPYTGTSYSRRSEKGIPFYRIIQAINAMMEIEGDMPSQYKDKSFGGRINFRGFNYVVDFSGLPLNRIPPMYNFNFDQMSVMELCQEIADIISHDLFVSLLPVINHPASKRYYDLNEKYIRLNQKENLIAGIIRIDVMSRTIKPEYGSVARYINRLKEQGIKVTNSSVGYELSNVPTDRFIVGAQEVEMYYFSTNSDRDNLEVRKSINGLPNRFQQEQIDQWWLTNSLKQQVLPFYGFLGKDAVSVPRGYGSFQQIMLDTSDVHAHGLGNYYVATEIELRAAAISYDAWKEFLLQYNDLYMESVEENDTVEGHILEKLEFSNEVPSFEKDVIERMMPEGGISNNYAVTVPRSVFMSESNFMGADNLPASPCNPPFGYPLYYKRATKIGIPEAGLTAVNNRDRLVTSIANLKNIDSKNWRNILGTALEETLDEKRIGISQEEKDFAILVNNLLKSGRTSEDIVGLITEKATKDDSVYMQLPKMAEKNVDNSLIVYNFLKDVANQNLGKKFLVKIPKETNVFYDTGIEIANISGRTIPTLQDLAANERVNELQWGPFGFAPRQISSDITYNSQEKFNEELYKMRMAIFGFGANAMKSFLDYSLEDSYSSQIASFLDESAVEFDRKYGALQCEYNSITDQYEFNYQPEPQGGFFEYELFNNIITEDQARLIPETTSLPLGSRQALIPKNISNFLDDNNRVGCYVRFDNSQYLNFKNIPKDSIAQQIITEEGYIIPDVTYQLENMEEDKMADFPNDLYGSKNKKESKIGPSGEKPKSVAFVKCSLDNRFYMPPRISNVQAKVFAREVNNIHKLTPPKRRFDTETGEEVTTMALYKPHYVPASGGGGFDGKIVLQQDFNRVYNPYTDTWFIDTTPRNQDIDHVYALITLPAQVDSTVDARYKDGPFQSYNNVSIKHFLTMDTVKGVTGFDKPAAKGRPTSILCDEIYTTASFSTHISHEFIISDDLLANAYNAYNASMSALNANSLSSLMFTMPSPVYPDMVAVPLLSRERCYGPWLSTNAQQFNNQSRFYAIPGKVEFIKQEDLAPWNYGGYQLLNEAGALQAEFSNSRMLITEKGSFTYEGLPSGNSLGNFLVDGGPLVTNIDVSVDSSAGVTTTYSMNIYTPRFGKLQRQKETLISQISRERQRSIDERNDLIRKGLGKSQKSINYNDLYQRMNSTKGTADFASAWSERVKMGEDLAYKKVVTVENKTTQGIVKGEVVNATSQVTNEKINPVKLVNEANDRQPNASELRRSVLNSATEKPAFVAGSLNPKAVQPTNTKPI